MERNRRMGWQVEGGYGFVFLQVRGLKTTRVGSKALTACPDFSSESRSRMFWAAEHLRPAGKILCTAFAKGREHDFALFKKSKLRFAPQVILLADAGYQGVQNIHINSLTPQKATKLNRSLKHTKKKMPTYLASELRWKTLWHLSNASTFSQPAIEIANVVSGYISTSSQLFVTLKSTCHDFRKRYSVIIQVAPKCKDCFFLQSLKLDCLSAFHGFSKCLTRSRHDPER